MPWLKSGINKLIPSLIWQPDPPIKETISNLNPEAVSIDVGAGGRRITNECFTIDFISVKGTDLCADIHRLPIKSKRIDAIFCTGTFEHIHSPEIALTEFHRILKHGGLVYLEVPFMQPYHADPEDYYRWTLKGLRFFCNKYGFTEIRSGTHLGPVSAMNKIVIQFLHSFFDNKYPRKLIEIILSFLLFPFIYLDYFLIKKKKSFYMASGVYFIGKKSEDSHSVQMVPS